MLYANERETGITLFKPPVKELSFDFLPFFLYSQAVVPSYGEEKGLYPSNVIDLSQPEIDQEAIERVFTGTKEFPPATPLLGFSPRRFFSPVACIAGRVYLCEYYHPEKAVSSLRFPPQRRGGKSPGVSLPGGSCRPPVFTIGG